MDRLSIGGADLSFHSMKHDDNELDDCDQVPLTCSGKSPFATSGSGGLHLIECSFHKNNRHRKRERTRLVRIRKVDEKKRNQFKKNQFVKLVSIISIYLLLAIYSKNSFQQQQPEEGSQQQQQSSGRLASIKLLPDLTSSTSDEPVVAVVGQDAFLSCVAKNLQNYTIIWRYTNEANAPAGTTGSSGGSQPETGIILTAGKQRVISDERYSVIQSHDTWLLKVSNVRLADTGTYICHTNSEPRVRALRILSVIKAGQTSGQTATGSGSSSGDDSQDADFVKQEANFADIDYNFTDCCRGEFVSPRCQRLCQFKQLASRYQTINIVHECFSHLPSITRCMVVGRNVTDCCTSKRHIPSRCNSMCGHTSDNSQMSVQDQSYCADYSASIMSCVAEGISTLPGQPELVIVEAVSSTTLKVSWQNVTDENELRKLDGWIINLTKLSSFEDTIASPASKLSASSSSSSSSSSSASSSSSSTSTSSSFSSSLANNNSDKTSTPLANLTIVDVMNNSSLMAMTKLLAASSGTISLKLDKLSSEFSIDNLKPYTVYQIQMFAYNSKGRSQLTDPIRALTLAPENELPGDGNAGDAYVETNLPDTRKCCVDRGVTLKRCLDTLCDPVEADRATIADLMICAPWSNITFSCLSSRVNHTDCCKSRGVSPFCLSMCAGDIKRVDYRHFRCLTHMSTYTNCILESHNVLPSAPLNFTVGPITHTWAVLNWRPPKKHARSLQGFRIFWRRVEPNSNGTGRATGGLMGDTSGASGPPTSLTDAQMFYYNSAEAATNPYLLDALQPDTVYETFVVAVNKYGQSESSVRFIFQTLSDPERVRALQEQSANKQDDLESRLPLHGNSGSGVDSASQSYYNETACCSRSGVNGGCLQLCDYDLRVSDVSSLITNCNSQMPVILRCMAGSRNSVPCCRNRAVADHCLNVCAGLTEHSPLVVASRCAPDFGKIIRCMDEGSKMIPSAPLDLHTVDIKWDQVRIKWSPASEDSLRTDVEYHVRYQQLQASGDQSSSSQSNDLSSLIAVVPLHPLEHNINLTTNKTEATVDKLRANTRYSIYVTAENSYGISLPSLVLVIQTPPNDDSGGNNDDYKRRATLGAPHSLEILRVDTESIVLKWIAPLFISNDAQIKYRVFYKLLGSSTSGSTSGSSTTTTTNSPTEATTTTAATGADQSQQTAVAQPSLQLSSNWTVIETSDNTIILRNLRYSSQYVMTVQAFTKQMLGHMSEILLANTAKPIPPTLNHPLVINNPIEGKNITIMCVALGQPTPQISMFINGLLVQKRTQPYVIYHLVNLVRGHLTITCFASNGHGQDYASVQSRTEVSVKFASKATAKVREVRAAQMAIARLTCELTGNPQPTILWTFTERNSSKPSVIIPNERITTLVVSQFEDPFTWSHTLTIRNLTQSDAGLYQCHSRNILSESVDSIQLTVLEPSEIIPAAPSSQNSNKLSYLKQVEQTSDLMECCKSQNVSAKCLPVCSLDGLDVETAFKIPECQTHLDKLMFCAADGSDHRNCCRTRQVPPTCLRWCSGAKLNIPALCFLSSAIDINQCFLEGRTQLPGPPRNVRVLLASESEHTEGDMASNLADATATTTTTTTTMNTNMFSTLPSATMDNSGKSLASDSNSANNSSVISSMAMMVGDSQAGNAGQAGEQQVNNSQDNNNNNNNLQQQQQQQQQHSEPLIIEWDPPIKNPDLVQYYRIFWRPFGSRELSRTVTNLTWIKLNDLSANKIYEFVVKAANTHGSSIYSDPLQVKPAEILANSNQVGTAGLIWFMPSSGAASLVGRVMVAVCFATLFMFSSLALVIFLERKGYLKRFASSKSNSSRISFANPAYLKESDGNQDGDNITWDVGHSLDVLAPPTPASSASSSSSLSSTTSQPAQNTANNSN